MAAPLKCTGEKGWNPQIPPPSSLRTPPTPPSSVADQGASSQPLKTPAKSYQYSSRPPRGVEATPLPAYPPPAVKIRQQATADRYVPLPTQRDTLTEADAPAIPLRTTPSPQPGKGKTPPGGEITTPPNTQRRDAPQWCQSKHTHCIPKHQGKEVRRNRQVDARPPNNEGKEPGYSSSTRDTPHRLASGPI